LRVRLGWAGSTEPHPQRSCPKPVSFLDSPPTLAQPAPDWRGAGAKCPSQSNFLQRRRHSMKRRLTKDGTVRGSTSGNRRDFLKASALAAGYGVFVATGNREVALAQQEPNEKVNVAWVGVGGKG